MEFDNIIIHSFPGSPLIAKAGVNMRSGKKIVFRYAMRDLQTAQNQIANRWPGIPVKVINYK